MYETYLIMGLNLDYNVDASVDPPTSLLPGDLFSQERITQAAFSAEHSPAEISRDSLAEPTTTLTLEIWQTSGCAPVLAMKLISDDFMLTEHSAYETTITAELCTQIATDIFDDLDIEIENRSVESLFNDRGLPFLVTQDEKAAPGESLGDFGIKELLVPAAASKSGGVAAIAFSGGEPDDIEKYMSSVVLVGIQAQRIRLNRMSAIWVNGPKGSDNDTTDTWHRSGTQLLQESGLTTISGRALVSSTTHWTDQIRKEIDLSSELLQDTSTLVPALQQAKYQERMGTLENQKFEKKKLEEELRQREEDATKIRINQEKEEKRRRNADERRRNHLVFLGSCVAFLVTVFALVPAIGALPDKYENSFFGPGWAWKTAILGVFLLTVVCIIIFMLINLATKIRSSANFAFNKLTENIFRVRWVKMLFRRPTGHAEPRGSELPVKGAPDANVGAGTFASQSRSNEPLAEPEIRETTRRSDDTSEHTSGTDTDAPTRETVSVNLHKTPRQTGTPSLISPPKEFGPLDDVGYVFEIRTRAGSRARAKVLSNGKVQVRRGALVRAVALPSTTEPIIDLRTQLVEDKILGESDISGLLELTADYDFLSFAQAAGVILGRSTIGYKEWSDTTANQKSDSDPEPASESCSRPNVFCLKSGKSMVAATARYDEKTKEMTVFKGSTARARITHSLQKTYVDMRKDLIDRGILVLDTSGTYYDLQDDVTFNSSSMAARIFLGRSASGSICWEQEGTSVPLGEVDFELDTNSGSGSGVLPADIPEELRRISTDEWELNGPGGTRAFGSLVGEKKFKVFARSQARIEEKKSITPRHRELRRQLVNDLRFRDHGSHYELMEPVVFDSPSQAAGVLLGRTANGLAEWRNETGLLGDALEDRV